MRRRAGVPVLEILVGSVVTVIALVGAVRLVLLALRTPIRGRGERLAPPSTPDSDV